MAAQQYFIKSVSNQPRVFYDDGRGGGFKNVGAATNSRAASYVGPGTTRVDPVTKKPLPIQPRNVTEALDANFAVTAYDPSPVTTTALAAIGNDRTIPGRKSMLRYPYYQYAGADYDYVFFEFGEYAPPFLAGVAGGSRSTTPTPSNVSDRYKNYQTDFKVIEDDDNYKRIIMYMPQDIAATYAQNWQGKEISNIGKGAISAANGNLANASDYNFLDGIRAAFASMFTTGINSVPGVGGNFTLNDITSSTRGVLVNPNVEVLYDNPELREFSLRFKLTPHDENEAKEIRSICNTFKRASLPGFGTTSTVRSDNPTIKDQELLTNGVGGGNYIRVPNLVRVSFMKGSGLHPYLPQYKVCAIKRVQVNYTPDGAYATYRDGSPVATELLLSFLETKLIFREEISITGVSL